MDLPWIVLFTPLVSAFLIGVFTKRLHNISAGISILAVLISLGASIGVFLQPDAAAGSLSLPWLSAGDFQVNIGLKIDQLSKAMMLIVTVVGTLVHLYSFAYMAGDDGKGRFFGGLSLFMFSMLGIVFADNFVMMFIFWELVGVSSYLLIGHWYNRKAPPAAANKAFLANRVGDFGFMLGILLVWLATKAINFDAIQGSIDLLKANPGYATLAALAVFCGAVGKSAQFPLHVWLPDAMEGPTPVSALIHAATMVAAGVYMLARVFFVISASATALTVIMTIGLITALLAALIATQQDDIKRILAYSTLSQLGYMIMAVGLGSPEGAMFHLTTHAFFKALLFLGSGAVIYACHHEQNIWKMGGLFKKLPITAVTFAIGTVALMGIWGTSGFYSKDAILIAAEHKNKLVLWGGLLGAFLTAYYMTRLFVVVFFGAEKSEDARKAHEAPLLMTVPLILLAIPSIIAGYAFFIHRFLPTPEHVASSVPIIASVAALLGIALGFVLYKGKSRDPIEIRPFVRKLYFDEAYALLIRFTQDLLASISAFIDRWVIDLAVRLIGSTTWGAGFVLRQFQVGNLQGYAFLFGVGVIALLYYVIIK